MYLHLFLTVELKVVCTKNWFVKETKIEVKQFAILTYNIGYLGKIFPVS